MMRTEFSTVLRWALAAGLAGAAAASDGAELLRNPNFREGSSEWWLVGASWTIKEGQACVKIDKPGINPWDVILGQSKVPLKRGRDYVVSFSAYASEATMLRPRLQFDAAPWTQYFEQSLAVGPDAKVYRLGFTMRDKDDAQAGFQFQLGAQRPATVCFGQVSVADTQPAALAAPAAPAAPATAPAVARPAPVSARLRRVRVNQLGYLPGAPKRATIASDAQAPLTWQLRDAGGHLVAHGNTRVFGLNKASGEMVHIADFSTVGRPGAGYVLSADGDHSHPFRIGADLYRQLKADALGFFYQNRSGIAINAALTGGAQFARPAGHKPDRARCFSGGDDKYNVWPPCEHELDVTGGWYDAGDHGKYVVNGGIALWTLQHLAERTLHVPGADPSWFADGKLALPERGNGFPGLLNEARWQMDFMLAMQVPDGRWLAAPVGDQRDKLSALKLDSIDAGGMAHHKVHDSAWTEIPIRPDRDTRTRHLYYPTTAATLNLAATAAQCTRLWRTLDPAYAQRCYKAATRAWDAAIRHPAVYAYDLFSGGGPYDDLDVSDEFYWAAAELFLTTGDDRYLRALQASPRYLAVPSAQVNAQGDLLWADLSAAGTIALLTVPGKLPAADAARARERLLGAARGYLAQIEQEGYLLPYTVESYPWGSNANIINRALVLGVAHDLTREPAFFHGAAEAMNYLLGRNPMDQSYVSGYGARTLQNPHHRFWARQRNPEYPGPPPGVLSGGPNSVSFSDPVAAKLKGFCTGQTCWVDDIGAWTMNEVAINWNAPLVWVAAFLDEGLKK
jgi:endoglucanase